MIVTILLTSLIAVTAWCFCIGDMFTKAQCNFMLDYMCFVFKIHILKRLHWLLRKHTRYGTCAHKFFFSFFNIHIWIVASLHTRYRFWMHNMILCHVYGACICFQSSARKVIYFGALQKIQGYISKLSLSYLYLYLCL